MSVVEILTIAMTACGMVTGVTALVLHLRRPRFSASPGDAAALEDEVSKLRAEVGALRSMTAKRVADEVRRRPSTFMDMAEALNHLKLRWPTPTHDESVLRLPARDLDLGKRVRVRLLNGKEAEFTLPAQTRSGTKFRFRGGGEDGRDLHLEVLSNDPEQDGAR